MLERSTSFYCFEFLDDIPGGLEGVREKLSTKKFVDIEKIGGLEGNSYIGPDRITDEISFVAHPTREIIAFTILYQSRKYNERLYRRELEKKLATDYFGQNLSKDDLELIKETVKDEVRAKSPVIRKFVDVIIDLQKKRIYLKSCGENHLWKSINLIAKDFGIEDIKMRPWFNGDFIERAGGWEAAQTIFIHWLNNICNKENKYNIFAGTKLNIKDDKGSIKIAGDSSRFGNIWDLFDTGRRIDSCEVVLKEKVPKTEGAEEHFKEVLKYRVNLKKLGFSDFDHKGYKPHKELTPSRLVDKVTSLEEFLEHFDSLCVAFQTAMQSQNMKDLYEGILKWNKQ